MPGGVKGRKSTTLRDPSPATLLLSDTLVDYMTVEEMLTYTAEMKRLVEEDASMKVAAVEDTINALGLASCRKVKIGK